jgi:carboxyl-terminal processing protease
MKKLILITLLLGFTAHNLQAQNSTYRKKLFITGKIWGYMKYFHSEVSTCQVDWDSLLVSKVPLIKSSLHDNEFNDILMDMLNAAGPMALDTTPFADTTIAFLKRNRNTSWMNDPVIRADVKAILDTVKNNFRPHPGCYVENNDFAGTYQGWLKFPHDNPIMPDSLFQYYPDEAHRVLSVFKYWNIIRYFNPYNYVTNRTTDTLLSLYVLPMATSTSANHFYFLFEKLTTELNDANIEELTGSSSYIYPEHFVPGLVLRYIEGKYVIVKSNYPNIAVGNTIFSVNDLTTGDWEDSLKPYVSNGNPSAFHRFMEEYLISGASGSTGTFVYKDSAQINHSVNLVRNFNKNLPWFNYFPNDTLQFVSYHNLECGLGYVNMGNLQSSEVSDMYDNLKDKKGIVFDLRNGANGSVQQVMELLYPSRMVFARRMEPDVLFPGTFRWKNAETGFDNNPSPYPGKVFILHNDRTQNEAEYAAMMLERMTGSVKIGSQTAGAIGHNSWFDMAEDTHTGFTNVGVFYPNGDSVQRRGILPNMQTAMTIAGIKQGRDELLEKAIGQGCLLGTAQILMPEATYNVHPNPFIDHIYLSVTGLEGRSASLSLQDIMGRTVWAGSADITNGTIERNIHLPALRAGVYMLSVQTSGEHHTLRVVSE